MFPRGSHLPLNSDPGLVFPKTSGPDYGLNIAVDATQRYSGIKESTTFQTIKTPFRVSIFNISLTWQNMYINNLLTFVQINISTFN